MTNFIVLLKIVWLFKPNAVTLQDFYELHHTLL